MLKLEPFKERLSSIDATKLLQKYGSNEWINVVQPHAAGRRIHRGVEVATRDSVGYDGSSMNALYADAKQSIWAEFDEAFRHLRAALRVVSELRIADNMGQAVPADPKKDPVLDIDLDAELGRV